MSEDKFNKDFKSKTINKDQILLEKILSPFILTLLDLIIFLIFDRVRLFIFLDKKISNLSPELILSQTSF